MKNKLFLLPILALGTLLGACKEKIDPIYIDEWLDNAKEAADSEWPGKFYIKETNSKEIFSKDYGLFIAKEIKKTVQGIEATAINEVRPSTQSLMRYSVYAEVGKFVQCRICFYSDGIIETHATYRDDKPDTISYADQNFSYNIGEEKISSLLNTFKNRYEYILNDRAKEDEICKNRNSIENFLESMEASKDTHYVTYTEINENTEITTYCIQDDNLSILNSIKELDFNKLDNRYSAFASRVSYYIDNEWELTFYKDGSNKATITYINVNSKYKEYSIFSQPWYYASYSVESTKLAALIENIENQINK